MTTSEEILKWFDENKDWFKPTSICKKLKIDKGNFSRYLKTGIPEKYLIPIMEIIMPLGFTLDPIIEENNRPDNKAKIEKIRNPIKFETGQELVSKIIITDQTKPNKIVEPIKPMGSSKSNYTINTAHEPKEGSGAFWLKYGVGTWAEVKDKK